VITTAAAIAAAAPPNASPAAVPATAASAPPLAITSAQRIRHSRGEGHLTPCSGVPGMASRYPVPGAFKVAAAGGRLLG